MSFSILVGLEPPKSVREGILNIREELGELNQQNRYGKSVPHITLFVNTYDDLTKINDQVKSIARNHQPFKTKVHGVHSFGYDAKTDLYTLVYLIEENSNLKSLQMDIVNKLNPLRNNLQADKCLTNSKLTGEQLQNVREFGFPYSPINWNFHATIGSFPEELLNKVQQISRRYNTEVEWLVNKVQLMKKKVGESPHKLYKEIKL